MTLPDGVLKSLLAYSHHLSGKRRRLAAVFALSLGGAAVSLSMPLLGKAFIDAVASRGDFGVIPMIAAALLGLAILDVVLATVSRRVHARLSADVLAELRSSLFARCLDRPLDAVEAFRHGDLLTRFGSDVPRLQGLLVDGLLGAVHNVLFLGVAAAILFGLSPALALWSFLGLALALVATVAFRGPVESRTRRVRETMVELSHFLSERLGALRAIRMHRAEAEEQARLAVASGRLEREVVSFQVLDAMSTGVPGLLLTLALAWIYLLGGNLLETGAITLGTFVAFVLYQGRLFSPAQGLLGLVRSLQEAGVSLSRVAELMGPKGTATPAGSECLAGEGRLDIAPAPAADPIESSPQSVATPIRGRTPAGIVIEMRAVTFAYSARPPVLRGVNLRVDAGERVGLFGASGAGKSTLVQLLFGLRSPAAGSVTVDGQPAGAITGRDRRLLGYAGAEPFLLHATVEENLRYGNSRATRDELERAVAIAEAGEFITALPYGDRTVIGGRGLALSDGQRQRLGLARMFLRDPRMLVLDESFSGLDLETETRVRDNLWRAFPDRTALVVSHRPVGLEAFDRLLFLLDGELTPVAPGELCELLTANDRAPWEVRSTCG